MCQSSDVLAAALMAAVAGMVPLASAQVSLVSTTSAGVQATGESAVLAEEQLVSVSADGRYACFTSLASDLIPFDGNGVQDVFVKDRQTGVIERISVGPGGIEGNGASTIARITSNGRFVVFESSASNLVPGDANGQVDVFLRDRLTGVTELVSVGNGLIQGDSYSRYSSVSNDGRFVTWASNATTFAGVDHVFIDNIYLRDRQRGVTTIVTNSLDGDGGNGISQRPVLSADGSVIIFSSLASDLAPGPINPSVFNLYAFDRLTSTTTLLTVGVGGVPANGNSFAPQVSANGHKVIFASFASNLTSDIDLTAGRDIFVLNRATGSVILGSVNSNGEQGLSSGNGSFSINDSGRFITFRSDATNLVASDTNGVNDLFRRDLLTGVTTLISIGWDGAPANAATAHTSAQSSDGTTVIYGSFASNLVAVDTNGLGDVFARTYPNPVTGDLNGDGLVNGIDIALVLGSWGGPGGDLNEDDTTDGTDLAIVLGNWTG